MVRPEASIEAARAVRIGERPDNLARKYERSKERMLLLNSTTELKQLQVLEQQLHQWMTTAAWQWYHAEGEARERIEQGILQMYN